MNCKLRHVLNPEIKNAIKYIVFIVAYIKAAYNGENAGCQSVGKSILLKYIF
jgi:hypothetical protein